MQYKDSKKKVIPVSSDSQRTQIYFGMDFASYFISGAHFKIENRYSALTNEISSKVFEYEAKLGPLSWQFFLSANSMFELKLRSPGCTMLKLFQKHSLGAQ